MARFEEPSPERPVPIGRYELVERIGFGGMAEVFLARLPGPAGFEKTVVIKRILPRLATDPLMVRMFVEEACIAAAADHDNIAKVHELGRTDDGQYFMVMEFIDGIDLELLLQHAARRGLRVPPWFGVHVTVQTLEALSFVHGLVDEQGRSRNVIHRDATPSNIFVSHAGQVKLSDFGVADFEGKSPTTQAGQLKGKLAYMSPEQLRARILDPRADLFAVGVVLWEALTQERLFGHLNDMQAMMKICEGDRPNPSEKADGLPAKLDSICQKALAADRELRYVSAEAFQNDLLDVLHDLHPPVRPRHVRTVLEELLGKRPPAEETQSRAPRPDRDKSFLISLDEPVPDRALTGPDTIRASTTPVPSSETLVPMVVPASQDLEATDADLMATLDEGQDPAIAIEVGDLRAMAEMMGLAVPPSEPSTELVSSKGAVPVGMEISGDQTVSGQTLQTDSGPVPAPRFWIRAGPGASADEVDWARATNQAREAGEEGTNFEISPDGRSFLPLAEMARLTGQDLIYELDPPSNVTVVGSLSQRSLTAVLAGLAVDQATGVLTVARPEDGAWYELEIHEGRPTRIISPTPETQLPQILVAHTPLEHDAVAQLAHRALASRQPLADLVKEAGGPDLAHGPFMRARLRTVFPWVSGEYTFNADLSRPRASLAFASSFVSLLPSLVASTWSMERLESELQLVSHRIQQPGPRFALIRELISPEQRALQDRLLQAPLADVAPRSPVPRRAAMACTYVLREAQALQ